MELNYSKNILKDVLKLLTQMDEKCDSLHASNVVLFNSKHLSIIKEKKPESTVPYYKESSLGEFNINSQDAEIISAFEKIKSSIKEQL